MIFASHVNDANASDPWEPCIHFLVQVKILMMNDLHLAKDSIAKSTDHS